MLKRTILIALVIICVVDGVAWAKDVSVQRHIRKNGSTVAPHHRTSPNGNTFDNYGSQGNVNPSNGKVGKKNPVTEQYRKVLRRKRP